MPHPVPCHVEHAYALRTTDMYTGADHVILDGGLVHGRLRRDLGDALCKPATKFRHLEPTGDDRDPTCVTCLAHLARLTEAGLVELLLGGERTRASVCLTWAAPVLYGDGDGDTTCRCAQPFVDHDPLARVAGYLHLAARRAKYGRPAPFLPSFVRDELSAAAGDPAHPAHQQVLAARLTD